MKLNRWMTLLAVTGTMASAPLFAQNVQKLERPSVPSAQSSQGSSQDVPWANQRASMDAAKKLQQSLKDKGYDVGNVDGLIGPRTQAALKQFQRDEGLEASGEIDTKTLSALDIDSSEFAAFGISEQPSGERSPGTMERGSMPSDSGSVEGGTISPRSPSGDVPSSGMGSGSR